MASRVTLEKMRQHLEQFGWSRYKAVDEPIEKEGIIYTGWRSSTAPDGFSVQIDPMVEKNCLAFRVCEVVSAPREYTPSDRLTEMLMALGWINYAIIIGKFSYDPRDGEVRFSINVPIDENDFTYEQFRHSLALLVKTVEEYAPKLNAILAGRMTCMELVREASEGALGNLAHLLEQLLESLDRRNGD